jgi:chemotaxis protein MotB
MLRNLSISFATIVLVVLLGSFSASAQWFKTLTDSNRLSLGLYGTHYRDLLNTRLDRQEFGYEGADMAALKGNNTRFDMGFGVDVLYFISPTLSLEYSGSKGKMTGANAVQYYESDVRFNGLALNVALKRWITIKSDKWTPYMRFGWDRASFSTTRFFEQEPGVPSYLGEEKTLSDVVDRLSLGLGTRYHLNNHWHLFGSLQYASMASDGWDGYNYAYGSMRGRDDMLQGQVGLRFTPGKTTHMDRKPHARSGGAVRDALMDSVVKANTNGLKRLREHVDSLGNTTSRLLGIKQDSINRLKDDLRRVEADLRQKDALLAEVERQKQEEKSAAQSVRNDLTKALEAYAKLGIVVKELEGKVNIVLPSELLFATGSSVVNAKGKAALLSMIPIFKEKTDMGIMVEGHTDNKGKPASNWKLSVDRANSVVQILTSTGQVKPERLIAAGRGQYRPVNTGSARSDLAQNRRVEIILTPQ